MIRASDSSTTKQPHPCHGYDAALGDLVMKIEQHAMFHDVKFEDVMFHIHVSEFRERFTHIALKYDKTADELIERMYELHNSWEDD